MISKISKHRCEIEQTFSINMNVSITQENINKKKIKQKHMQNINKLHAFT